MRQSRVGRLALDNLEEVVPASLLPGQSDRSVKRAVGEDTPVASLAGSSLGNLTVHCRPLAVLCTGEM